MEDVGFHMRAMENKVRVVHKKNILDSRVTAIRMMGLLQVQLLEQDIWHTLPGPCKGKYSLVLEQGVPLNWRRELFFRLAPFGASKSALDLPPCA